MVEKSEWVKITDANPEHSSWYIERFRAKAAAGEDLSGEARMINAMVPKGAHILDAGCGPGRTGGLLAELGHEVVGVDVDPILIAAAEEDHPGPTWLVGDLAELDLASRGVEQKFDVIVSAGNVMAFLAPSTRSEVLRRLGKHLTDDGRLVVGFGSGPSSYDFADFFDDVESAGLTIELKLSTWDLRPFTDDSDFLVAILHR
ncbi:MAG: SAM-dependent methyltransferase [Actinobacteria bacterium]|nr:MAG: SAM-dependent methyltransferase [Actinomycetota bacterium]